MSNLALKKLPLEKEIWVRPEEATNGVTNNYDGRKGFAHATWPCEFTLDLESERKVRFIRFLLWDNLGRPGMRLDARQYKFSLSISSDGKNFITIFSNQNQEGGSGWFEFEFINEIYFRFIRLSGHFNTANKEFHIVEFEVYEKDPTPLKRNSTKIKLAPGIGMPSEQRLSELINQVVLKRSEILVGVEEKINHLDKSIKKAEQSFKQIELIKKSNDFTVEAQENQTRSMRWLAASGLTLTIFLLLLVWFIFFEDFSTKIILNASQYDSVKPFTALLVSAFYVSKAFLLSTLLFMLSWFLKNYRSEKHNYVVNKHKAMTLTVSTGILTKDDFKNADRENIFNQAMQIIFSHQASGFSKDEADTTGIISSFLQKGISKSGNMP